MIMSLNELFQLFEFSIVPIGNIVYSEPFKQHTKLMIDQSSKMI